MTKRIAVIGCSFTDYWQDKNINAPVKTWSEWMQDDNPDIHVDNYAASAHNIAYVEFVLRYIIKYRHNCYHAVMFNLPPWPRTWAPIRQNEFIRFNQPDTWFSSQEISNNYWVMKCNVASLLVSKEVNAVGFRERPSKLLSDMSNTVGKHRDGIIVPNLMVLDIIKNYYAKQIPNLIYWAHEYTLGDVDAEQKYINPEYPNFKGNLSDVNKCVLEFLVDRYGEYYTAEHLMTDSAHLSSLGNQKMYQEFLLPNQNVQRILKH